MSDSESESNWWTNSHKPKFIFNKKSFELMIHEVFLPKQLPDFYDAEKAYVHETRILALMADIIQELSDELPKSTHNMFQTWSFLQCREHLEGPEVLNAIASLKNGDMLALYIREQNCGFCLFVPHDDENRAIVSTFPVSLENSLVMSNLNDVQVRFSIITLSQLFGHCAEDKSSIQFYSLLILDVFSDHLYIDPIRQFCQVDVLCRTAIVIG